MKDLILYHGSKNIIEAPQYGLGNKNNDYGLAFYCTQQLDMALEWASIEGQVGFVNEYRLDVSKFSGLDLTTTEYHILNWLAILLDNRVFHINSDIKKLARDYVLDNFLPAYKEYDYIKGYRADDSYFSFANAFLGNQISLNQLKIAMQLGELGEQIAIKSKGAFENLSYITYHSGVGLGYEIRRSIRDKKARDDFRKIRQMPDINGVYMIDILRQEWRNDDERLR